MSNQHQKANERKFTSHMPSGNDITPAGHVDDELRELGDLIQIEELDERREMRCDDRCHKPPA